MKLNKNMGRTDRLARFLFAVVVVVLILSGMVSGLAATILGILAAVFLLTSFVSFCPLYLPFGFSTRK